MKRFLAYLFLVLGLGLIFNTNSFTYHENTYVQELHPDDKILAFCYNKSGPFRLWHVSEFTHKRFDGVITNGLPKGVKCKYVISEEHNKLLFDKAHAQFDVKNFMISDAFMGDFIQNNDLKRFLKNYKKDFNFNHSELEIDSDVEIYKKKYPTKKIIAKKEPTQTQQVADSGNLVKDLKELSKLYEEGLLTEEEFNKAKEKLLGTGKKQKVAKKEKKKKKKVAKKEPSQTQEIAESTLSECKGKNFKKWTNCKGTLALGGDKFVGEWKDGELNGQGTFTLANGDKYVGEYKDDEMHGQGTQTWANGDKYVGEFKDSYKHGQGTYTWVSGNKYVGEWKDSKRHGQGTYTFADGRVNNGTWKNDKLVKRNKIQIQTAKKEKKVVKKEPKKKEKKVADGRKIINIFCVKNNYSEVRMVKGEKPNCKNDEFNVVKNEYILLEAIYDNLTSYFDLNDPNEVVLFERRVMDIFKITHQDFNNLTETQQVAQIETTQKGFNLFKREEKKITLKEVLDLGKYAEFNAYPEGMLKEFKQCKKPLCRGKIAGKKVYKIFVQRSEIWHQRHPGNIIHGMAWFEIFYLEKLRKTEKQIARYVKNGPKGYSNEWKMKKDVNSLHGLIKTNKGRIKMRQALGLSLNDDLETVLKRHWLLGDYLNKDKLKIKKVKISSDIKKREALLAKYKSAITKYKNKLGEERRAIN